MNAEMPGWRQTTLGAVCAEGGGGIQTGPFGSQLHASDYVADGIPSVMPQNIGDNAINADGIARITAEDAVRLSRYLLRTGDIVYSRRGDVEKRAWVHPENDGWLCGTGCLRVRLGEESPHDSRFVSYSLGTSETRAWIARHAVGATMPNLNTSILEQVPICIPDLPTQTSIADLLTPIEAKIAANRSLKTSADVLLAARLQALMLDGDEKPLSELADFVNGRAFTKGASGTGRVVIRIAELNSGIGASTVFSDAEVDQQHLARPGDVLFAWSGSLTVARWFRDEAIVNQHIFKVVPKPGYPQWLLFGLITAMMPGFRSIAADKATTMGHIQRRHLDSLVRVPSAASMAKCDDAMSALWDVALSAELETIKLINLRDELLQALMTGEKRVVEASPGPEGVF